MLHAKPGLNHIIRIPIKDTWGAISEMNIVAARQISSPDAWKEVANISDPSSLSTCKHTLYGWTFPPAVDAHNNVSILGGRS